MTKLRTLSFIALLLLVSCSSRTDGPILPTALGFGDIKTIFLGTTRAMKSDGTFGFGRSEELQMMRVGVSVPSERELGTIPDGRSRPDPRRHFVKPEREMYQNGGDFLGDVKDSFQSSTPDTREVTVFIHGYNNSFTDAAFRMAQLAQDLELPGAFVSYAWPSRGNPLGYEYDRDSALFARDGLERLLRMLASADNPGQVLVAHSMGSALLMETLRQIEIAEPGWVGRNIPGVILIAPDLNPAVFRGQIGAFQTVPDPFVIMVSRKDRVLRLSARIRGDQERLGNLQDSKAVSDLPVSIVDVSEFAEGNGNHFTAGSSPALLQLFRRSADLDREFLRGRGARMGVDTGSARTFVLGEGFEGR